MKVRIAANTLRSALQATAHAALKPSKDDRREHLACVRLAVVDGALDVVATNGSWLARWREPGVDVECGGRGAVSVTSAGAKALAAALVAYGALPVEIDFDALRVGDAPIATLGPDAPYPQYDIVIPSCTRKQTDAECAFDAKYLADIARACLPLLGKTDSQRGLRFTSSGGALDPVVITLWREPRLTIVLMPVRLERNA